MFMCIIFMGFQNNFAAYTGPFWQTKSFTIKSSGKTVCRNFLDIVRGVHQLEENEQLMILIGKRGNVDFNLERDIDQVQDN